MEINRVALAELRKLSGLSQAELARRGRFSQGYISELEKGTKQPSPAMVKRLAGVLGVDIAAIRSHVPSGRAS